MPRKGAMNKPENIWLPVFFAAALFLCFLSESILRQAAVSRINPDEIMMERVLSDLPGPIQERIRQRMLVTSMRNQLAKAETPREKASALTALAAALGKDDPEHLEIYRTILRSYPDEPASHQAYVFFMFNEKPELNLVSGEMFHAYQAKLPPDERYNLWVAAFSKMQEGKPPPSAADAAAFLAPLAEITDPPFFEFGQLYGELAKHAARAGRPDLAKKAVSLMEKASFKRTYADYLIQVEENGRYRNAQQERRGAQLR